MARNDRASLRAGDLGGAPRRDHAGNPRGFSSVARITVWRSIGEIAEGAALKLNLPPRELERYLTENIDFSLDEENLAGLRLYYEECARAGLIPRARELEFAGAVSVAR